MAKIDASQILKVGADLKVEKIDFSSKEVKRFVEQTKLQQKEVLRFRVVDQEKLKSVVQLF
jgi:hypothetical protein